MLSLLALTAVTDTGPIGEEFGWRGFALPQLLRRWSPLAASLVLGAVWGVWHLPTFFIASLPQSRLSFPLFVLNSIALSVIMTWLYLRTGGDLLLMILVHLMANDCTTLGVPFNAEAVAEIVCALGIIAAGGLRNVGRPADGFAAAPDTPSGDDLG
jgi:membrane protease YdiL (CAAX protease family)